MKRLYLVFLVLVIAVAVSACKKKEAYTETNTTGTTVSSTETTATPGTETSATTTTSTAAPLNDTDKDFVTANGKSGKAEVELANDALTHATNPDVKAFAQKLVDDHTKANQELTDFATARGVTMPSETEGKLKEAKERLLKLTGKNFDQAFVSQMIDDHKDTIKAFEKESKEGTDAELKAWVDKTLPTLRDHLKAAEDLQAKIGKR